ncbi:MAG TPA: c-type cytochrome biogenesis protein CcsB [Mycobacteriales bacterium]|nr:c-type cytochrome biogenesis protein CcsB [Mycobacteriales bacterium]
MTDKGLGQLGDGLLFGAVIIYALAMLGFAGEQASRKARQSVTAVRASAQVLVGSGGPPVTLPAETVTTFAPSRAGRLALALTGLGWLVHLVSIVTRGFAADRVPWGNMYEFSSCVAFVAVTAFLVLVARRYVERSLGAFVMLPVVLYLGLAATKLYTAAGPLVPALNSYWIKIHVAAAITASGAFLLSGVVAVLYLVRSRYDETAALLSADPRATRRGWLRRRRQRPVRLRFPVTLGAQLPAAPVLDRVSYVVIAFAFPVWTFAVIAGAIWAEAAWGRYWGWDPKETWSFITWVLYAGYLHARATAGWKGRKAAWVAVAAACALVIDYYVVNIFVVGLHSYA